MEAMGSGKYLYSITIFWNSILILWKFGLSSHWRYEGLKTLELFIQVICLLCVLVNPETHTKKRTSKNVTVESCSSQFEVQKKKKPETARLHCSSTQCTESVSLSGVNRLICCLPSSTSLPPCLARSASLRHANARWHFVTRILNYAHNTICHRTQEPVTFIRASLSASISVSL